MKKYLLLLFLITSSISFSQENECEFSYNITFEFGTPEKPWDAFAKLSYDFSKLNLRKDNVQIEVVGILDCWNNLKGSQLRETVIVLDSKSKNFRNRGVLSLRHNDLRSKCFKYRVVVKNNKCEKVSDWNFVTYNF